MSQPPTPLEPVEMGWYRDPADPRRFRYWTGHEWLGQHDALAFLREGWVIWSPQQQPATADPNN